MVIFYKTLKKCHEIQLTKNKMDLNKSKMKNINAWLELEPNFPGVTTPQTNERIIYIISYTYNPFTAPWRVSHSNTPADTVMNQHPYWNSSSRKRVTGQSS